MEAKVVVRRLTTAGGTFVCALAIGYFMQAVSERELATDPASSVVDNPVLDRPDAARAGPRGASFLNPEPSHSTSGSFFSEPNHVVLTWTSAEKQPVRDSPSRLVEPSWTDYPSPPSYLASVSADLPPTSLSASDCPVSLKAQKSFAATARLKLDAPCLSDTAFTLHHSGLMFTATTDSNGRWEMAVPALTEQAVFVLSFANGTRVLTSAVIDTVPLYERYVLQWEGRSGLELHAFESGVPGRVSADLARDSASAVQALGGFVTRLGPVNRNPGRDTRAAQVYTLAALTDAAERKFQVHAEAEIHEVNCGQNVEAQILIQNPRSGLSTRDLVFSMPDCDDIGDLVVLKDFSEIPRIAKND